MQGYYVPKAGATAATACGNFTQSSSDYTDCLTDCKYNVTYDGPSGPTAAGRLDGSGLTAVCGGAPGGGAAHPYHLDPVRGNRVLSFDLSALYDSETMKLAGFDAYGVADFFRGGGVGVGR
jgi:hypothetical protein